MPSHNQKVKPRLQTLINNISKDFSIDKLSKSPARFDVKKLQWFNENYIRMLSLEEFAYRADKLKLEKRYTDKNLRVGDYVYLVDLEKQMVFGEVWDKVWPDGDGYFYPLGGCREDGESPLDCACREVLEESDGQLHIQPEKMLKITVRQHLFLEPTKIEGIIWEGKEFNIYFCEIKYEDAKACKGDGAAQCDWIPLDKVISENQFLTFPIWQNFCQENDLPCFEPGEKILQKLLSYRLDQNRVKLLSEIGTESSCLLDYKPASVEEITWKKSTQEESLQVLREIQMKFINNNQIWNEFYLEMARSIFNQKVSGKLREGAYCLIIDFENQKVIVENNAGIIGGGIDQGETALEAVVREVREETEEQVVIDQSKLIELGVHEFEIDKVKHPNLNYDGKKMHIFIYPYQQSGFANIIRKNQDFDRDDKVQWMDLDQFLNTNSRIPYLIFKDFCFKNSLDCKESINQHETTLREFYRLGQLEKYFDLAVPWFEDKIKSYLTENNKDFGAYLWPLRLALSGKRQSPSPFELLVILSQEEASRRINHYLLT